MTLPDLRHIQCATAKMASHNADMAFVICVVLLRLISKMASDNGWTNNARNGVISFDSCLLNAGVDHDHVTNNIVGGDKSHRLLSLLQMFEVLENNVKSAHLAEESTEKS